MPDLTPGVGQEKAHGAVKRRGRTHYANGEGRRKSRNHYSGGGLPELVFFTIAYLRQRALVVIITGLGMGALTLLKD
jgi:hypothetical protein